MSTNRIEFGREAHSREYEGLKLDTWESMQILTYLRIWVGVPYVCVKKPTL